MTEPAFDLIETMAFDPEEGTLELERHLARLKASAVELGFTIDRHAIRNEIHAATFRRMVASRIRLRLSRGGSVAIEVTDAPAAPVGEVAVALCSLPVAADDLRLRHKTSDRAFYDAPRQAAGTFETLFVRDDGLVTEGSFTNLFVADANGRLVTPRLDLGLLPGVLRDKLLDEGRAVEGDVRAADLAGGFFIGNALRGLMPARLG